MVIRTFSAGCAGPKPRTRLSKNGRLLLLLMAVPSLVFLLLFSYVPLFGWILAFFDYKPGYDFFHLKFTGFRYFEMAFSDKVMLRVLRNTLAMSGLSLLTTPLPMIFAIFLAEIRSRKVSKFVQVSSTLPNFISWILVFSLAYMMFSVNDGLVNRLLLSLGLTDSAINFLTDNNIVWFFQTGINVWKNLGYSAIIYVAAITSIDQQLIDAAVVDGAGRFQRIWHVTIPGLLPTYFVLLLLSIGNLLNNGFEQYYMFYNGMIADKIEVLDYYVYRMGILLNHYPISTAIGMVKTLISLLLLTLANQMAKGLLDRSIF